MPTTTHSIAARNAATDAVTGQIGASGNLKFRLSGSLGSPGAVVATLPLSATAFGASSGGTATANAITPDTNAVGNASPVAAATLEKSDGTIVIHLTAGASVTTTVTGNPGEDTVTVGSAAGLVIGMHASGTGIAAGADIVDIQGTTVHLSVENSGAVSGNGIFSYDVAISNGTTIAAGDTVSCSSLTYTALRS
ncbi:hypothetical protein Nit79A3_1452 [Nitrosomonas sp. Is79A3]|uniref:hypothetical protein n=1 Tax=Nitrosomonas sp. (strain Is79A3) TaxID=261292 RepID=UPI000215D0CA